MRLNFLPVTHAESSNAKTILKAYLSAFPPEERRSADGFSDLFQNRKASVTMVLEGETPLGYLIFWPLNGFLFLEHFEVFPQFRGQDVGSKILKKLSSLYPDIILESEPGHLDDTATKRIRFYKKNGFHTIKEDYIQPAYSTEKQSVNLWLMANFFPISTNNCIEEIYAHVYNQ